MSKRAATGQTPVSLEQVQGCIFVVRGQKIILDRDLAILYEVKTKVLNLAVKRNRTRFPTDFMFQLTVEEAENLRFQFETSSSKPRNLAVVFDAIRDLMTPPPPKGKPIGFT